MCADTTIGVSNEVKELVRSSKQYKGQTYDELLRKTFSEENAGEHSGGS